MHKYLGIDYGAKRVGLALADSDVRLAQPLATLDGSEHIIDHLRDIIATHGITHLVVGLPRNLEGEETAQTVATRQFAAHLHIDSGLPVVLQDEALTSQEATKRLEASHGRNFDKTLVDQEAAAIILQDYLGNV